MLVSPVSHVEGDICRAADIVGHTNTRGSGLDLSADEEKKSPLQAPLVRIEPSVTNHTSSRKNSSRCSDDIVCIPRGKAPVELLSFDTRRRTLEVSPSPYNKKISPTLLRIEPVTRDATALYVIHGTATKIDVSTTTWRKRRTAIGWSCGFDLAQVGNLFTSLRI